MGSQELTEKREAGALSLRARKAPSRAGAPLLAVLLLTLGCTSVLGPTAGNAQDGARGAAAPKTLHMVINGDPPTSFTSYGGGTGGSPNGMEHFQIFHGGLTAFDPQDNVLPHVAQKIPSVADGDWVLLPAGGMQVTWRLRPDVFWHDAAPLTAEDFVFGFKLLKEPELAAGTRGEIPSIAEVQALDAHTLVVRWKNQSIFGNRNAHDGVPAVPRHLLGELYLAGDMAALDNSSLWGPAWVGIGPYRLNQYEVAGQVEATAFERFFLGRPKIDRIIIRYMTDPNTMVTAFLAGALDVLTDGSRIDLAHLQAVLEHWRNARVTGGSYFTSAKSIRTLYLQMRNRAHPWAQDVRVRHALLHAIDREGYIEALLFGFPDRANFFVPQGDPLSTLLRERRLPVYDYDSARAERLFAEAGLSRGADRVWRTSAGAPVQIDVTSSTPGANVQEATLVASQWSTAGLQSKPTPYPPGADAREAKHDMQGAVVWPWSFSPLAERTVTSSEIGSAPRWLGNNWGGYSNPAYDGLFTELTNAFDPAQRQQIRFQLARILAEDLPILPLYYAVGIAIAREGVQGLGPTSSLQLGYLWNVRTWDIH